MECRAIYDDDDDDDDDDLPPGIFGDIIIQTILTHLLTNRKISDLTNSLWLYLNKILLYPVYLE